MGRFRRFRRRGAAPEIDGETPVKKRRGRNPESEEAHAVAVARHVREKLALPEAAFLDPSKPGVLKWSHVANETGVASPWVQARKSAQGMEPGVADYFFAIRNDRAELATVWIELKKARGPQGGLNGSEISDAQRSFVEVMHQFPNTAAHFAHGSDELIEILESYIFTK